MEGQPTNWTSGEPMPSQRLNEGIDAIGDVAHDLYRHEHVAPPIEAPPTFWAQPLSSDSTSFPTWRQMRSVAGGVGFEAQTNGMTHTNTGQALYPHDGITTGVLTGTASPVLLVRTVNDSDGKLIYKTFSSVGGGTSLPELKYAKVIALFDETGAAYNVLFTRPACFATVHPSDDANGTTVDAGTTLYVKLNDFSTDGLTWAVNSYLTYPDEIIAYLDANVGAEPVPGVSETTYNGYVVHEAGLDGAKIRPAYRYAVVAYRYTATHTAWVAGKLISHVKAFPCIDSNGIGVDNTIDIYIKINADTTKTVGHHVEDSAVFAYTAICNSENVPNTSDPAIAYDGVGYYAGGLGGITIVKLIGDAGTTDPKDLIGTQFYVRVTANDGSTWVQVDSTDVGVWAATTGGITSTSTGQSVREKNGATTLPYISDTERIFLCTPTRNASGDAEFIIDLGAMFPVLTTYYSSTTDGTDGDATHQINWEYDVTYRDGSLCSNSGSGQHNIPENARPIGKSTKATKGYGYWHNGGFELGWVNEGPSNSACP